MERGRRQGSPVEEDVEGLEEGVEGVDLSIGEGVDRWFSSSIFSFGLFMYVSCDFVPHSCLLGSFVTCSDVFSMFILSKHGKSKQKMNCNIVINQPSNHLYLLQRDLPIKQRQRTKKMLMLPRGAKKTI